MRWGAVESTSSGGSFAAAFNNDQTVLGRQVTGYYYRLQLHTHNKSEMPAHSRFGGWHQELGWNITTSTGDQGKVARIIQFYRWWGGHTHDAGTLAGSSHTHTFEHLILMFNTLM